MNVIFLFNIVAKDPLNFSESKNKSCSVKYNSKIYCKHIFHLVSISEF